MGAVVSDDTTVPYPCVLLLTGHKIIFDLRVLDLVDVQLDQIFDTIHVADTHVLVEKSCDDTLPASFSSLVLKSELYLSWSVG